MGEHSRLNPSGAKTWCLCPGSVRMQEGCESSTSEHAALGTAAHELLERCLTEGNTPDMYRGLKIDVEEWPTPFTVDDDMIDAVMVAYNHVNKLVETNEVLELIPERRVDPGFLMKRDDCWGTGDLSVICPDRLIVRDYKHGKGVVVEAEGDYQTLLYGIGALAALPPERRQEIKYIDTGIMQPRASHPNGPIRNVVYPIETVYQWLMYFNTCATATDDPEAPLVAGEEQCRWCDAKGICPALRDKTLECFNAENMPAVESQVLRNPEELSIAEQNTIDDMGDIIEAFVKAVRAHKLSEMKRGVDYPGYKLVRGKQGNRKFAEEDEEKTIRYLNSAFGLKKDEVTAPRKLLGPAKIVAMAKKSEKANDVRLKNLEDRIVRPEGKVTCAPVSDPRPAVMNNLEEVFKDVPKQEN